jgi:DNA polymerase elongation subunit (family B)
MKILEIDIETSPNLTWTFETKRAFIGPEAIVMPSRPLCFAAKWYREEGTSFYSEWQHGQEQMLQAGHRLLADADVVLHYNGERFDERRLNQEFAKQGWFPPAPYQRIDLWKTISQRFDLPSQKLDYALTHFGLPNKLSTGGMRLWIAVMNGEDWARRKMEEYNRNDVEVMEPLYDKLKPWIPGHPNHNLFSDSDEIVCPTCGGSNYQKRGFAGTEQSLFQQYRCNDDGRWFRATKRSRGSAVRQVAA